MVMTDHQLAFPKTDHPFARRCRCRGGPSACLNASSISASGGGRVALWVSASEPAMAGTMFLRIQDTALCAAGPEPSALRREKMDQGPEGTGCTLAAMSVTRSLSNVRISRCGKSLSRRITSNVLTVLSRAALYHITIHQYNFLETHSAPKSVCMWGAGSVGVIVYASPSLPRVVPSRGGFLGGIEIQPGRRASHNDNAENGSQRYSQLCAGAHRTRVQTPREVVMEANTGPPYNHGQRLISRARLDE